VTQSRERKPRPTADNGTPEQRKVPRRTLPRIERGNLHDDVVVVLRDMIVQDQLPPGTRIAEAELCEQFGISRTPLREAIRVLVSEGLVTLVPRKGAMVATPTLDEIKGMFCALGALEAVCAPMACANFTDADIKSIEREHELMQRLHDDGRLGDYYRANIAIHDSIVEASRNTFLTDLHRSISVRIMRDRYFVAVPKDAWRRAMREHNDILEAIRRRDGERLGRLLLSHMMGSWHDFESSYSAPANSATVGARVARI
jgi:DNA-binding GntR family transcriptional regulator